MQYKDCGCRDDDHDACPQCEGWSQAELDRFKKEDFILNEEDGTVVIVISDNEGRGLWASVRQEDESEEIHKNKVHAGYGGKNQPIQLPPVVWEEIGKLLVGCAADQNKHTV
jgi:hypothetical protein